MKSFIIYGLLFITLWAGGSNRTRAQSSNKDLFSPEIVVVSPELSDFTAKHDTVVFKGIVLSYKLPLVEVAFLLNGNVVERQKPDAQSAFRYQFSVPIKLVTGRNNVTIIARNEKGQAKLSSGTIVFDAGASSSKPRLFVLAIGLSTYADPALDLRYADADASTFAKRISAQQQCLFSETFEKVIVGKDATRSAVLQGLDWLNKSSSPDDLRIVFIAGRTGRDDSGSYYLLTTEHYTDSDLELADIRDDLLWNRLSATSGSAIVFMDRSAGGFRRTSPLRQAAPPPNIVAITSPAGAERFESSNLNHTAFTAVLLEGLSGQADTSQDQVVDTDELWRWMQKRFPEITNSKLQPLFWGDPARKPIPLLCIR